jgi:N-glycosylase/DNA lyase
MDEATAEEAYEFLLSLSGVGPRSHTASAVFKAGMRAFPGRLGQKGYESGYGLKKGTLRKMREYAAGHFGEFGGIAQQYLFYHVRNAGKKKREKR